MKKVLFLIHDLGQGGAEKVLVNLVNNMDPSKFDITVTALFGGGVNEQFLAPHIRYRTVFSKAFPGNSHIMKLLSPRLLHRLCVKERYDIEVSYLEGPSARIISGCKDSDTRLVCWIHSTINSAAAGAVAFRSFREAASCYGRFQQIVCVSNGIRKAFLSVFPTVPACCVLYNTIQSDLILESARESIPAEMSRDGDIHLTGVGTLKAVKGFDRLIRVHKRLRDAGYPVITNILGRGPDLEKLRQQAADAGVRDSVRFLGYDTNPYKYVSRSDLFVCSSHSEGFSTAATEALIVGTPVCTVEVSGMKEMLGENNEFGVVTENDEDALYQGIKKLLDDPALLSHYREKAAQRGKMFSTESTVRAVETMLQLL